jgi:hypothetical protein
MSDTQANRSGQLSKMGILPNAPQVKVHAPKRSSIDFAALKPLKSSTAAKNFAGYRDAESSKSSVLNRLNKRNKDEDGMDSDGEEDEGEEPQQKRPEIEEEEEDELKGNQFLSPDDITKQDRLAEGVKKINLVSILKHARHLLTLKRSDKLPQNHYFPKHIRLRSRNPPLQLPLTVRLPSKSLMKRVRHHLQQSSHQLPARFSLMLA